MAAKKKSIDISGTLDGYANALGKNAQIILGNGKNASEKNLLKNRGQTNALGIMLGNSNVIFPATSAPSYGPKAAKKQSLPFEQQTFWGDWLHQKKK